MRGRFDKPQKSRSLVRNLPMASLGVDDGLAHHGRGRISIRFVLFPGEVEEGDAVELVAFGEGVSVAAVKLGVVFRLLLGNT